MEISYQDFERILKQHQQFVFGMMTNQKTGCRANLERADLSYMDLSGIELRGAYLHFCNFAGCNLSDAKLAGANLQAANLKGVDLSNSYMDKVDLKGADLSYSKIDEASLSSADLRAANLRFTLIRNVDMNGANLKGADFYGVIGLESANLQGAVYDINTRWPYHCFLPEKMGLICEEEEEKYTCSWQYRTYHYEIPTGEIHQLRCKNCGRLITDNNQRIEGACQSCQGEGVRNLIAFDWFTGGRFFG